MNALDHGVLGLNSSLKSDPSGFASYFEDREKKLKVLDSGYVKFDIAIKKSDRVRNITIQLEDSGDGFDYKNYKPLLPINSRYVAAGYCCSKSYATLSSTLAMEISQEPYLAGTLNNPTDSPNEKILRQVTFIKCSTA